MTVNVITAEDIEKQPYTNIGDLLATIPGISAEGTGSVGIAGANRISIRGEAYGRTLIMINGVKVVDKDKSTGVVMITPSQIERIEVIKGPASVLYGAEAIGGVINIITKKGGPKPVGFSLNTVLDSSTESADLTAAVFGSHKGFNYRFSANGVNVKDRKIPKGSRDNAGNLIPKGAYGSHYQNRYYSGQLGYDWDKYTLSFQFDKYENVSYYSTGEQNRASRTIMYLPKNDRETFSGTFTAKDLGSLAKLTVTGSYQNTKRNLLTDPPGVMYSQIWSDSDQYSGTVQTEWSLGQHYLTFGLDYIRDEVAISADNRPMGGLGTANIEQTNLGVFAQDEWKMADSWRATMGLRQTWFDGKAKKVVGTFFRGRDNKKKYSDLVGSLGLVFTGVDDLAIRAQWSQGTRYPSVGQLFTGTTGHFLTLSYQPNPDLKPERSNSFELGGRYLHGGWDLDLAIFYTEAKDFIDTVARNGVNTFINQTKAQTQGLELTAAYTFEDYGLTPYLNGTFSRREVTILNGQKTHKTRMPPLQGRVGLKFEKDINADNHFYSDLYMDWAVKTKTNLGNNDPMSVQTISNVTTTLEAWQNLCFSIGMRGGADHKYNVSLSVRNIFNQKYSPSRGPANLPAAGLHAVLGVGYEY
jgi:hemoglobin/transferrin/lactoferrin receptor protein